MNARVVVILLLWLSAGRSFAQRQDSIVHSPPSTVSSPEVVAARMSLQQDSSLNQADVIVGKDFEIRGPLVAPFKAHKLREVPRRLLHLVNPFAPVEPREELERVRGLTPRAWVSTVGWSTGRSSLPVEVTHEPVMGLVSVSAR
jgi:hypothetical protein